MASILDRVIPIVAEQFGVQQVSVTPETHLINDLGADSLDVTEMVMELEEEFSINIPDDRAEQLKTVAEIVGYISTLEIDK